MYMATEFYRKTHQQLFIQSFGLVQQCLLPRHCHHEMVMYLCIALLGGFGLLGREFSCLLRILHCLENPAAELHSQKNSP